MMKLGCISALLGALLVGALLGLVLLDLASALAGTGSGMRQEDNVITLAAREMTAHLHGPPHCPSCAPDAWYDAGFPPAILAWGQQHCPGCSAWQNGQFQCVVFVLAAYALFHPLPLDGNADLWWGRYGTPGAQSLGFQEIAAGGGRLPASPGDIMAWSGGANGHVSIVLGWAPPVGGQAGTITFANANGQQPIQTLPIRPDFSIDTSNGYWNSFFVQGYIHPSWLPAPIPPSPGSGASAHVVRIAQRDPAQYANQAEWRTWAFSTCSTASMTEVMDAYGRGYRITDVLHVEAMRGDIIPSLGLVTPAGIADTLAQFGFADRVYGPGAISLDQVIGIATSGTPVIVGLPPDRYAGGHLLVVVGGNATTVRLVDSSAHDWQIVSRATFLSWWGGRADIVTPS